MTDEDFDNSEPSVEPSEDEPILGAQIATNAEEPAIDDDVDVDTLSDDE